MSSLRLRPLSRDRLRPDPGVSDSEVVARLVLGGQVEVEVEGRPLSGSEAYGAVVDRGPGRAPRGRTARLSLRALQFGQALSTRDVRFLARRLYWFNALPASSHHVRRLAVRSRLSRLLDSNQVAAELSQVWGSPQQGPESRGWMTWRNPTLEGASNRGDSLYKLYLSPWPEELVDTVFTAAPILARRGALAFKVASAPALSLRPDKFVVYFPGEEQLRAAATELRPALSGIRPHGVPFSEELDSDGLLSWGIDPPSIGPAGSEGHGRSWRGWITEFLAKALIEARGKPESPAPWEVALARLSLRGIDDESFGPQGGLPWLSGSSR